MHERQSLGEALSELPLDRLAGLHLSETLLDAVTALKTVRSHEARRRQAQYVGKLMRTADIDPIREAVASARLGRAQDSLALHEAERWRAELLASDDALTAWMQRHPHCDLQHLRSLIRAARKEAAAATPPTNERKGRCYRELFLFIKQGANDE